MAGIDASTTPSAPVVERSSSSRFRVDWVRSTESTNADLLAAATSGVDDGAVLVADHQTAGRGRRGRTWEAPPGASLLMSVLLRPAIEPSRAGVLTAAVGLAAREASRSVADVVPTLKWPNDLVADTAAGERKLGGILAESQVATGSVEHVVIGLGLNVHWPDPGPEELAGIAVALNHLRAGPPIDRVDLVRALLDDLERRLQVIERGDDATVWNEWRQASATLGRRVRVETTEDDVEGAAEDITELGRLVVRGDDGRLTEIDVGDVVHLRRADPAEE